MINKRWIIKEQSPSLVLDIANNFHIPPLLAKLLINREITNKEDIKIFLDDKNISLHSPFLLQDMEKAVSRILLAKRQGEKVAIYGDYDVDGVTSVSLLYLYLREMGIDTSFYIPERVEEGYGINLAALQKIKEQGTSLLITVDCGITAVEEIAFAKSIGLDVIITDHHECKDIVPECVALINPKLKNSAYPFKNLAGVGVAFKLACALDGNENNVLEKYSDILAMGTVADVVSLSGENRIFVREGLKKLNSDKKICGIKALLEISLIDEAKKITTSTIGFSLAPRINAAGRVGCAMRAVELLITKDYGQAKRIAEQLCGENKRRQDTENDIIREALQMIEEGFDFQNDRVIVLSNDTWHHGIIGIVASRLVDKYHLPAILISNDGDMGKGSGRSIKGFNLFLALEECKELLDKYGGHTLAAGLSVKRENFEAFKKKINSYAKNIFKSEDLISCLEADCEIFPKDISYETATSLNMLEPYGMGNPVPLFCFNGLRIIEIRSISNGKHMKIIFGKEDLQINAMYFGKNYDEAEFIVGDEVNIMCNVDINCFRGNETVQLIIRDLRICEEKTI